MVALATSPAQTSAGSPPQETCSAELLEEIETTFAAALRSVSAAMPGQDLRTRGWAPAEPLQAFLHAVERLTEMQGPRNHTVLMCAAPGPSP